MLNNLKSKLINYILPNDRISQEISGGLVGIHSFTAYDGTIERDESGKILNPIVYIQPPKKNMIVNTGKNLTLDRLFSLSGPPVAITSIGVGTDSTAASVSQTQLNPSVAGSVLIQTADAGTARVSQTVTIQSTFGTSVANFTWNEAGLFNGNTNGTSIMFSRLVIGPFTKTSSVSIVFISAVTQS